MRSSASEGAAAASPPPEISVVLATYNHAAYIGEAIESVLTQKTSRTFELLISEDCSIDGTREIAEEAARGDPRVRLLSSPSNLRSNEVIARGIRGARGRYVCLLDGDDKWIVPDKLERQASLLDCEPGASACFGNALIVRGTACEPTDERWTPADQPTPVSLEEIWRGNPFATSAGMIRRSALVDLGSWYTDFFPVTDWPLYILCAQHGEIIFLDEPIAAYRLHEGGLFSALPDSTKLKMTSRFFSRMNWATGHRWNQYARRGQALYFLEWAEAYASAGEGALARAALGYAFSSGAISRRGALLKRWAKAAMKIATRQ